MLSHLHLTTIDEVVIDEIQPCNNDGAYLENAEHSALLVKGGCYPGGGYWMKQRSNHKKKGFARSSKQPHCQIKVVLESK